MYFVNYRENYDFARYMVLTEPVEAYLYYFNSEPSQQASQGKLLPDLKQLKYPNRPEYRGMQSFLVKHGFVEDTSNFALNKITTLKIFDLKK